jgi:acyl-CoA thioesterase-1
MKTILFTIIFLTQILYAAESKKLLFLGDSITEGLGVAKADSYPSLIEKKVKETGKNWVVVNASISGSTTASGPSRMKWQLKAKPDLVVLALGANDGLRGLDLKAMEKNLSETIEMAQNEKIQVVLAGMMMPPNYGKDYRQKFQEVYPRLAKKYHLKSIPFLLDGVAGNPELNQADGIHPNEKGHKIIADRVWAVLKDLL